jgi:acyl-coenzyme A thioesterase PaaI-like protein
MYDRAMVPPFAGMMGFTPVSVQPGRLIASTPWPAGTPHTPWRSAMLGAAAADNGLVYAAMSLVSLEETVMTTRFSMQWLGPATPVEVGTTTVHCVVEDLDAVEGLVDGRVLHPSGRRAAVARARVRIVPRVHISGSPSLAAEVEAPAPSVWLGSLLEPLAGDYRRFTAIAAPFLANSLGYLHGGATIVFILAACERIGSPGAGDRDWAPVDLDVHYLAGVPAAGDAVELICEVTHSARSMRVLSGTVLHDDRSVALFRVTQSAVR